MLSTTSKLATIAAIALALGACGAHAASTAGSEKAAMQPAPCFSDVIAVDTANARHRTTIEGAKEAIVQLGWAEPSVTVVQAKERPELRNRAEALHALGQLYPKAVRDQRIGGEVTYAVLIDANGRIVKRRLMASSGNRDLDFAGAKALDRMKFHPAQFQGCRVASWTVMPLKFWVE
jgi:TonB family protein